MAWRSSKSSCRSAVALLLLVGCWTGSPPPPPAPVEDLPSDFTITMKRTACFGPCPIYAVSIDGDGRVRWVGYDNVVATGPRRATVPPKRVAELKRALERVQFFERDEHGNLIEPQPECVRTGTTTSCTVFQSVTICSDTSRAIITVRKGGETYTVTNDHCDRSPLEELESLIDDIARTSAWIGQRVMAH